MSANKNPLFALVDCNSFFVSCELIFRPNLIGKPVVVLSSGDGCVVARSREAIKVGIPMGAPVFKYRHLFAEHGVISFSANFELYGDISRRITEILTTITPRLEVYSIDESFLDISQLPIKDYETWGREVYLRILQWVGVPVRIGIAPSKALAKLAADATKHMPEQNNAMFISPDDSRYKNILENTPIESVWGVGRKQGPKLRAHAIGNAYELSRLRESQARSYFGSVLGARLHAELNGISCFPLELIGKPQKTISATRTFGEDSDSVDLIQAALASFVSRACTRLRDQGLTTKRLSIFLTTNRHKPGYRSWKRELNLDEPTADTGILTVLATELFWGIHGRGQLYHRGGVTLHDLGPENTFQTDLFSIVGTNRFECSQRRMKAVDEIRAKYGHRGAHYVAEDLALHWQPKRQTCSPHYTTNWSSLRKVKIKSHVSLR